MDISYGQSYTINKDGLGKENNDPNAPDFGFAFKIPPQSNAASAIVYQKLVAPQSSMQPFYISQNGPLNAGEELIYPVAVAQLFFSDGLAGEIRTMPLNNISCSYSSSPLTVKFKPGVTSLAYSYSRQNQWALVES